MTGVPESGFAIAAFIVLALPGFVFAAVSRWFRGESPADRDVTLTIARGAIFAVSLSAVYLILGSDWVFRSIQLNPSDGSVAVVDPKQAGFAILVFYLGIPAALSICVHLTRIRFARPKWLTERGTLWRRILFFLWIPRSKHGYTSVVSAWNFANEQNQHSWVKVKRANGEWIGGWYTEGSFVTTYPEPRSIYIGRQYAMTKDGNFVDDKPIPGAGVFLVVRDDDMVFWVSPARIEAQLRE